MTPITMPPTFFTTPALFRKWLEKNHDREKALLVGFYRKDSGIPSITWPQSVDQALAFGWIDGVRKRIDDVSYSVRFTPRKPRSIWSAVNIGRVTELTKLGLMHPAGLSAFELRSEERSRIYAYEKEAQVLPPVFEKRFRAKKKAWAYFSTQAPSYQRVAIHWVVSAKKEETRERRLITLIDDSAAHRRLGVYTLKPRK